MVVNIWPEVILLVSMCGTSDPMLESDKMYAECDNLYHSTYQERLNICHAYELGVESGMPKLNGMEWCMYE